MLRSFKVRQCRPYRTALHCTALHCTALHCTALHARKLLGAKLLVRRHRSWWSRCSHELQSSSSPTSKRTKKPQSGSPPIGCAAVPCAPTHRSPCSRAELARPPSATMNALLTSCACGPAANRRRAGAAGGNHRAAARRAAVSCALRHEVVGAQLREGNAMRLSGERAEAHSRSHVQSRDERTVLSECMRVRSSVCAR